MDIRIIVEAFNSQNICLGLNKFYLYFFNSSGIARTRMTGMFMQEYASIAHHQIGRNIPNQQTM